MNSSFPDLSSANIQTSPFEHFTINDAIAEGLLSAILDWLKNHAPWSLTETDFYEQYEFSLLSCELPLPIKYLSSKDTLKKLQLEMSRVFKVDLCDDVEVTAHKLLKGQTIRIHNDYIDGAETHRLLIQINDGWSEANGGQLMFFSGGTPEDLCKIISPISGSIQAFAISPRSHHAVSTVHRGERYTLVYSFHTNPLSKNLVNSKQSPE